MGLLNKYPGATELARTLRPSDPPTLARFSLPPARPIVGAPRVNTVKYNRFHDQLLVSGSSDCMVHLWRVSSVSSAPLLEPEEEDAGGLDGADGEGFGGSNGGSKGEAADIRVSRCVVFFARISTQTSWCHFPFSASAPASSDLNRCSFVPLLRPFDERWRGT